MNITRSIITIITALLVLLVPAVASAQPEVNVEARRQHAPHGYVWVVMQPGKYNPDAAVLRYSSPTWFLDGVHLPQYDAKSQLHLNVKDGKRHTLTVRMPRADGSVYQLDTPFRAVRSLKATGPLQSAAIARKRGVLVRINAARGLYRANSLAKKIPGAGTKRITAKEGGVTSIRVKGSYLDRIRPGMKMRIKVRHFYDGHVVATKHVTVRFR